MHREEALQLVDKHLLRIREIFYKFYEGHRAKKKFKEAEKEQTWNWLLERLLYELVECDRIVGTTALRFLEQTVDSLCKDVEDRKYLNAKEYKLGKKITNKYEGILDFEFQFCLENGAFVAADEDKLKTVLVYRLRKQKSVIDAAVTAHTWVQDVLIMTIQQLLVDLANFYDFLQQHRPSVVQTMKACQPLRLISIEKTEVAYPFVQYALMAREAPDLLAKVAEIIAVLSDEICAIFRDWQYVQRYQQDRYFFMQQFEELIQKRVISYINKGSFKEHEKEDVQQQVCEKLLKLDLNAFHGFARLTSYIQRIIDREIKRVYNDFKKKQPHKMAEIDENIAQVKEEVAENIVFSEALEEKAIIFFKRSLSTVGEKNKAKFLFCLKGLYRKKLDTEDILAYYQQCSPAFLREILQKFEQVDARTTKKEIYPILNEVVNRKHKEVKTDSNLQRWFDRKRRNLELDVMLRFQIKKENWKVYELFNVLAFLYLEQM